MSQTSHILKLDKFLSENIVKILQFPLNSSLSDNFILIFYLIFFLLIILLVIATIIFLFFNLNTLGGLLEVNKLIIGPIILVTYILLSCFLAVISSGTNSHELISNIILVFNNYMNIIVFLLLATIPTALILSFVEVVSNNFFKTYYEVPLNLFIQIVFLIFIFSLIIFFLTAFKQSKIHNIPFILFNMSSIILLCISFMTFFKKMTTYLIKNILTYNCVSYPDIDICADNYDGNLEPSPLLSKLLIIADDATARNENRPLYIVFLLVLIIYIISVCFIGGLILKQYFKPIEVSAIVGCKILNKLVELLQMLGLTDDEPTIKNIQDYITKNCDKNTDAATVGGSKRKIKSKRK